MTSVYTTQLRRLRRATKDRAALTAALVVAIIVILVAAPQAQQSSPAFVAAASSGGPAPTVAAPTDVDLLVGRSTVLNVGTPIARVSLTVPDVADAMVTAPSQLLIHGKQPGTISLFVWDRAGAITTYEVKVRRDLTPLVAHLKQLFPGEPIEVRGSGKDIVVSGTVSSKYVIEKAADVAAGYVEKKDNVVNLLKQQEGVASNQVMLRVRFAEVSRSALQELGASFFANAFKSDWFGRTAPPGVPSPVFDNDEGLVFSDFLNLFVFNAKEGLGGVVRALQTKGLFQSLAEPNLIATNGKEASFLAGGEFPIPVVQGGTTNAVTVIFKEFGIRLNFTPTVLGGELVHLKVRPEVSALDFANAIELDGFRIPALSTRRTETEVELRDGQTFAIAGLMNNTLTNTMSKIPGLGHIPILGMLFSSKAHQKNQTELVVMITPTIIKRGQMGVSEGLPSLEEPYLPAPKKSYPNPDPYVGSPRYPANQPAPRSDAAVPASQPQASQTARPVANPTAPARSETQQQAAPAAPVTSRPVQSAAPAMVVTPKPAPLTKQQQKALEQAREEERKAAEALEKERAAQARREAEQQKAAARAEEKRRAEQAKKDAAEAKKAAEQARREEAARTAQEKVDKERQEREAAESRERAEREAEANKERERRDADAARRKAEEEQKRDKALNDAAARLRLAEAQYQAELERAGKHEPRQ
jgi:pilus assembly protein CpaC